MQRIEADGLGRTRSFDARGREPLVVSVADLALVRQGHQAQAALGVAVLACAAIWVAVAGQLAVRVVALAYREAEAARVIDLAVGDLVLGGSALRVLVVGGAADQVLLAVLLFIAREQAISVVLVADLLVDFRAFELVLFLHHRIAKSRSTYPDPVPQEVPR